MADLRVTVNGVKFPNPIIVGSASPSMDWIGVEKGIEGGSGVSLSSLSSGRRAVWAAASPALDSSSMTTKIIPNTLRNCPAPLR